MSYRGTRAGKFRQVITIEEQVGESRDESGAVIPIWSAVHENYFADVNPGRGREFEAAHQRQAQLTHLVTLRYIPGINLARYVKMRIVYAGRILKIMSIINKDEQSRELLLSCIEWQLN